MLYHEEYEHFHAILHLKCNILSKRTQSFSFFLSSRATEYDFPRGLLEAARDKGRVTTQRTRL